MAIWWIRCSEWSLTRSFWKNKIRHYKSVGVSPSIAGICLYRSLCHASVSIASTSGLRYDRCESLGHSLYYGSTMDRCGHCRRIGRFRSCCKRNLCQADSVEASHFLSRLPFWETCIAAIKLVILH